MIKEARISSIACIAQPFYQACLFLALAVLDRAYFRTNAYFRESTVFIKFISAELRTFLPDVKTVWSYYLFNKAWMLCIPQPFLKCGFCQSTSHSMFPLALLCWHKAFFLPNFNRRLADVFLRLLWVQNGLLVPEIDKQPYTILEKVYALELFAKIFLHIFNILSFQKISYDQKTMASKIF